MKTRESGMPEESMWSGFFSPELTLQRLDLQADCGNVVDFGCGYGTFAVPAARMIRGIVYALDVDLQMVNATQTRAAAEHVENIRAYQRDFVENGTGLPDAHVGYAMLFNILHCEEPLALLREAWRVLVPGGTLAVMHWNYDPATPRGPSMEIRPRPEQCRQWSTRAGFLLFGPQPIDLPPYHYGLTFRKPHDRQRTGTK
jgi:ubiquinone/menaquinone biosynthesis C-methylase UbiE